MNIDWSKAPEWATHALVKLQNPNLGSAHWSCLVDGEHRVSPDGLWFHPDGYRVVEERPRKSADKAWTGEGLPPVGTVCERRFHDTEGSSWNRVTVTAHGHKKIMCLEESGDEWAHYALEVSFRPARTPEQIAAEQRSADLNQMIGSIKDHPHKYPGVTHLSQLKIQEDACIDLYDAGWRKVTP
jgi:hypothetical protein